MSEFGALREHVAPAREAAFEQPRVDRGPRVLHEDVVLPDGELHFAAVFGEGALEELHRAGGDDRHVAERGRLADGLGGAFHLGQAAAVGADGGEHVVFPFELHAAQGVAAAFVVGGEDRAADQLAEQPGRELVVARFAELRRSAGNRAGSPTGQLELAALAADRWCRRCRIRCGTWRRCFRGGSSRSGRPAARAAPGASTSMPATS